MAAGTAAMRNRSPFVDGSWTPTVRRPRGCGTFPSASTGSEMCGAKPEIWLQRRPLMRSRSPLDRHLVDAYGETPQRLRDLSVSLNRLGDVRRETEDLAAATSAYEDRLFSTAVCLRCMGRHPKRCATSPPFSKGSAVYAVKPATLTPPLPTTRRHWLYFESRSRSMITQADKRSRSCWPSSARSRTSPSRMTTTSHAAASSGSGRLSRSGLAATNR